MNVLSLIQAAGPLLWVLLALSIYTIYLIVLRIFELSRLGQDSSALIERTRATTAESGALAALSEVNASGLQTPTANVLRAGLARADRGVGAAQASMNGAILQEDARLYAGISSLGTVAQIAPLIGLLGTVIGMVRSFIVFSQTTSPTPAQLATGISEALINTAGGLVVAIVAYVARNALRARADRIAAGAERVREELPAWLSAPLAPMPRLRRFVPPRPLRRWPRWNLISAAWRAARSHEAAFREDVGMRRRFQEEQPLNFDFAPMVDIVLLLLIFFFLTSNLNARQNALPLDLPRASQTVRETPELPIVSLEKSGKLYLNGKETTLTKLGAQLRPLLAASGGTVGLRADEKGNYGGVVQVMDIIKKAGGERLALGTKSGGQ